MIGRRAMLVPGDPTWQLKCGVGLTSVLAPGLDDFGPAFTCVLGSLGHAFPGHLVGVIGGTHRDLVLYRRQQCQV